MTPAKLHLWLVAAAISAGFSPPATPPLHAGEGPNLTPTLTPVNWSLPGIPRADGAATEPISLTPTLTGNAAATWFNWATFQESQGALPPWSSVVLIDGEDINALFESDGSTPGFNNDVNRGPFVVRGGRHTLTIVADPDESVSETSEADNTWSEQFVWSPLDLPADTPVQRTAPPDAGALTLPNSDGFMANRYPANAWAVGLAPLGSGDDYDLHVYDDYTGSSNGFSSLLKASTRGAGETDFVTGSFYQTPWTLYPAAVRVQSGGLADFMIEQDDASGRDGAGTQSYLSQSLDAGEVLDVFEVEMSIGISHFFTLQTLGGPADVMFEIFPGDFGAVYARGQGLPSWQYDGSTQLQVYVPSTSGWHPVVVYRPTSSNLNETITYNMHWQAQAYVDVEPAPAAPLELALAPPAPNPTHGRTRIAFTLPAEGPVRLSIYDVAGRRVQSLADGIRAAGQHSIDWSGRGSRGERLEAGVYIVRLEAAGRHLTRRIAILP